MSTHTLWLAVFKIATAHNLKSITNTICCCMSGHMACAKCLQHGWCKQLWQLYLNKCQNHLNTLSKKCIIHDTLILSSPVPIFENGQCQSDFSKQSTIEAKNSMLHFIFSSSLFLISNMIPKQKYYYSEFRSGSITNNSFSFSNMCVAMINLIPAVTIQYYTNSHLHGNEFWISCDWLMLIVNC